MAGITAASIDVFVLGAGAAGLLCAIEAGKRGRKVMVVDHARRAGEKIRISGGGRCNFTNLHSSHGNFLSRNPKFAVSALARYTPQDFIAMVERHGIRYHEKKLGQLFCDESSQQIINMLLSECRAAGVAIQTQTSVTQVSKAGDAFRVLTTHGQYDAQAFVVASGGLSIPKMGATSAGYDIARQFGLALVPTRAGLVPLTFSAGDLAVWKDLAGVSLAASVTVGKQSFSESMLFTHRGLSGPAILQISSYWEVATALRLNMAPQLDAALVLTEAKRENPRQEASTVLKNLLPARLAQVLAHQHLDGVAHKPLGGCPDEKLKRLGRNINQWMLTPSGSEGYRVAEVTLGGVDTNELSSQTMESKKVKSLYFIGEVVDVTGHLGGHNFHWAWASGYAAGQVA